MRRALVSVLLSALVSVAGHSASELANGLVAIVDGEVITYKDVTRHLRSTIESLLREYRNEPEQFQKELQKAEREAIEQLVERKLILHEFENGHYNLPESIIDDRVKERIRLSYGDRRNLTRTLEAEGVTFQTFKSRIREDFIISAMRAKNIGHEIIISPYRIERYYTQNLDQFKVDQDQVELRRIVLNPQATAPARATRKLAEEILAKLEAGATFEEMASVYSEGPERAQGGYWGWQERKGIVKELSDAAFALKPGQHTGVLELNNTCFLLQVIAFKPKHTKTLPEVRERIERDLVAKEQARLSKQWIDRLKTKSFVRYF